MLLTSPEEQNLYLLPDVQVEVTKRAIPIATNSKSRLSVKTNFCPVPFDIFL